jgi:hypothetical protein
LYCLKLIVVAWVGSDGASRCDIIAPPFVVCPAGKRRMDKVVRESIYYIILIDIYQVSLVATTSIRLPRMRSTPRWSLRCRAEGLNLLFKTHLVRRAASTCSGGVGVCFSEW